MGTALRLAKGYSAQVIYILVLPFFFFVFCMLYDPFRIQDYYSFGPFSPGVHLLLLSCILLVWLILSRTVFHFLYREFSLQWWQYALWCLGEVLVVSAFMALYTTLMRHEQNYFSVLALCLKFAGLTLVFPYLYLVMQQIIANKEEDLRNKDLIPDKNLVRFYDEHKRLKLTIAPSSVLYVKSEFNYLKIHYLSAGHVKEYTLRGSMKSLAESAPAQVLVRCQRSYFVNPAHVKVLWKDKEGFIFADLDVPDLPSIPVSKQYYDTITALL